MFLRIYQNLFLHFLITHFSSRSFFKFFLQKKSSYLKLQKPYYILSFDLDYSRDVLAIPEVLKILRKYSIIASFACIGRWVEKYPNIHKKILEEGHEIINHTYSHYDNDELGTTKSFNYLSFKEKYKEIEKFHITSKKILNYEPLGFRIPHFGRAYTKDIYDILKELNYTYSSSTVDINTPSKFGVPYKERKTGIMEIPLGCSSKFPFCIFDSWSSRSGHQPLFSNDEEFIKEFYQTINILKKIKSLLVHYFDPFDIIQNNKLDRMCQYLKSQNIQTLTCRELLTKIVPVFNGKSKERV